MSSGGLLKSSFIKWHALVIKATINVPFSCSYSHYRLEHSGNRAGLLTNLDFFFLTHSKIKIWSSWNTAHVFYTPKWLPERLWWLRAVWFSWPSGILLCFHWKEIAIVTWLFQHSIPRGPLAWAKVPMKYHETAVPQASLKYCSPRGAPDPFQWGKSNTFEQEWSWHGFVLPPLPTLLPDLTHKAWSWGYTASAYWVTRPSSPCLL